MRLLIVAATQREIAPYLAKNPSVHYLITGVGTASTIYSLTKKLMEESFDWVIQAGIAGTHAAKVPTNKVFVVKNDAFAQRGVLENGQLFTLEEKGIAQDNEEVGSNYLMNPYEEIEQLGFPLTDAITVDLINNHPDLLRCVADRYPSTIESMEGAAMHYVCLKEKLPFIQIRSISNVVGDRNKLNWEMEDAIVQLNIALERVCAYLTNVNE